MSGSDVDTRPPVPLSRNRDFTLLWVGQGCAEVGFSASMLAFPLVVHGAHPVLAVLASSSADVAQIAYEMTVVVRQVGQLLTPELRAELA